jgi:3-deoxy-D-manno-octulosonate 8-phosphate phosphatase (KDO 8-P phosphatase)
MRKVGFAIATANARPQAKAAAHYITPNPGGQGAGRDAIDFILNAKGILDQTIEKYLDPNSAEAKSADIGTGNM